MKSKIYTIIGILLIFGGIKEFFSSYLEFGFSIYVFLGVLTIITLGYYLIRLGRGKSGLYDR